MTSMPSWKTCANTSANIRKNMFHKSPSFANRPRNLGLSAFSILFLNFGDAPYRLPDGTELAPKKSHVAGMKQ